MSLTAVGLNNFTEQVINSSEPVLVDFWASWCGPCRALKPILESVSANGIKVVTVDIEKEQELTKHFGITALPTVVVFKNGKPGERTIGLKKQDELLQLAAT